MDNIFLLVVDPSPESSEELNSLLRNSGINVHVLHAETAADAERQIREFKPALVVYEAVADSTIPIERVTEMAHHNGVLVAIRFLPNNPEFILDAVEESACIALNASENDHLIDLVQQLANMGTAARGLSHVQGRQEELQGRFELLLDSTSEAVAYVHEGLHVFANPAYLDLLEAREFSELESVSLLEILSNENVDSKSLIRDFSRDEFPREALDFKVTTRNGKELDTRITFTPVQFDGESCVQMVVRRTGTQSVVQEEFNHFKSLDPLTGLMHRGDFIRQAEQLMDRLPEDAAAALYFMVPDGELALSTELRVYELDAFVLSVAQELQRHLAAEDLVCRFGDLAFSFFARRKDKSELKSLAQKIRSGMAKMIDSMNKVELPPSCSIGMSILGPQTGSAEEAMHQAREAAKRAFEMGDSVARYRPVRLAVPDSDEEKHWTERLKYALNNDDFYSVQRTIVNLEGDSEGLFENRTFLHEDDHDVPQEEFLPPAERNELASTIDREVIPGLLRAIAGTGDRHFINLSGNSVHDFSFPSWFQRQMKEFDVQGSQIILQISAHAAHANQRAARRLIEEMKPLGCTFSISGIDDKRPQLDLIERLDLAFVKLSQGLCDDLKSNTERQNMIRNVVAQAGNANAQVFVDDVRNSSDMAALWQCGVKLVSGDFLQETPRVIGQ